MCIYAWFRLGARLGSSGRGDEGSIDGASRWDWQRACKSFSKNKTMSLAFDLSARVLKCLADPSHSLPGGGRDATFSLWTWQRLLIMFQLF